jgi:hypothetical protein
MKTNRAAAISVGIAAVLLCGAALEVTHADAQADAGGIRVRPVLLGSPSAPPPYSLPWQLRPVTAATVVRLDETFALYRNAAGDGGLTAVTSGIVSWKASPSWVLLGRLSLVTNDPPGTAASGSAFSNVLAGVSYVRPVGSLRTSTFLAAALPTGQGGGDSPPTATAAAVAAGIPARSAMDNALFAVNYWTAIAGFSVARVTPALTAQAEATVLRLTRARGPATQDAARTNFTAGLHVGRFVAPRLSVSGELRMQRWLTDPAPVRSNPNARETVTLALGPRFHIPLAGKRWIRPGVSWTHALDRPLSDQSYDMIQVDLPLSF